MTHLFVTGVSGLLGGQLMARLLEQGRRLAVLVRPGGGASGRERVEAILGAEEQAAGRLLPRPVVLEGDLTVAGCGLAEPEAAWVRRHCRAILHNAASLEFIGADRDGEPWRTNVDGTRHLLALAERAGIAEFHHVSTAYVCGLADGPVPERPSTGEHGFRNDYEESKHEAEWLVRRAPFIDRPTFFRPAVIVGHSRTGATSTYHGMMAMLRLLAMIVHSVPADETGFRRVSARLPMTGDERRNVVPVDWVAAAIVRLLAMPRARGRTIHLAPDELITTRQIIDWTSTYLNSGGVEFCGPRKPSSPNAIEAVGYAGKSLYEAYEQTDPTFDTAAVAELIPDLPCPRIDEAMLHRFLAYGDADRWGKRRKSAPPVETWAEDLLGRLVPSELFALARALTGGPDANPPAAVGLDVVGPGGCGWTLRRDDGETMRLDHGIDSLLPVHSLPVSELASLITAGNRSGAAPPPAPVTALGRRAFDPATQAVS